MDKNILTEEEILAKKNAKKEYMKIYRENNKEKIKEINKKSGKKYKTKNKEKILLEQKEYRENNKEKIKEYRENNKEKIKEINTKYYEKNKEKLKPLQKEYYKNNKEKISNYKNNYKKNRILIDPLFKLKENLKTSIYNVLKRNGYTKKSKTHEILGCSFGDFKIHIESLWEPWMNWDNHGLYNGELNYGWDIDHIIPTSSANTEEELLKLNHYSNLQPLCSKINRDVKRNILNY
jgi:hypothetical protein